MLELESFEPKTRGQGPASHALQHVRPQGWRTAADRHWRLLRKNRTLLLMAAPGLLLLIVFNYLPMPGIIIAFKNFKTNKGILGSDWVGLKNFEFLFGTDIAWRITTNTLLLNSLFIVTGIAASLALALLLNEVRVRALARFYQSAVFFPYFVSWVIVGYFGFALLNADNGLLNSLLGRWGLPAVAWYQEPVYWPIILAVTNLWKTAGYWSIIYLAAMYAIGQEYYEAAMIDGASRWQQIVSITLPMLLPLIITNFLLSVGRIFFADFGLFYYVTRDSSMLYPTTDVIDTYVFRALRSMGDFGMAAAAGLYQSFVGFVLVVLANWTVKRMDPEKSLF
jgi:putative aldouronate transport system permease protein